MLATGRPDLGHALSLFLSERNVHVVAVDDDFDRLMDGAAAVRPDVVLVDWSLGAAVSGQIVAGLMEGDDPTPVVVLSTAKDRPRARATGAAACATLGDPPDALLATLLEVGSD
jgi:chemotaxis response regulator CheB